MRKRKKEASPGASGYPCLGSGLLARQSKRETGVPMPSCDAIFTAFLAWGFPCRRAWHVVFTVFDLPRKGPDISVFIRKSGSRALRLLCRVADLKTGEGPRSAVFDPQVSHEFREPGRYSVVCALHGRGRRLRIPLDFISMPWPEFTKSERQMAETIGQTALTSAAATIKCNKCGRLYTFVESVVAPEPSSLPPGLLLFPKGGLFECRDCGHPLPYLKDAQGGLRHEIKRNLAREAQRG